MPINYISPNVSAPKISAPARRPETLFGDLSSIRPSRADSVYREDLAPDQFIDTRMGSVGHRDRVMITRESRRGEFQDKVFDNVGSQGRNPRAYIPATPRKNGETDLNGRTTAPSSQGGRAGVMRFIDRVRAAANADQVFNGQDYDGVNFRGAVRSGHAGAYIDDPQCTLKERNTAQALDLDIAGVPAGVISESVATTPFTRMHVADPAKFRTQGLPGMPQSLGPSLGPDPQYTSYGFGFGPPSPPSRTTSTFDRDLFRPKTLA